MRRTLQLHVLRPATHVSPPPERARPSRSKPPGSTSSASGSVKGELAHRGYRVRAVSFTPTELVAYVEAAS